MPIYITVLYLFCATVTTTIGVLSLIKNPSSSAHRSYFFFTMSVLVWLICMYFGYYLGNVYHWYEGSLAFIRGAFASSFFLGLSLCLFFHYFPRRTIPIPTWVIILTILVTTALSAIALFTPLIEKALIFQDGVLYGDEFGPWYSVYVWYFLGSLAIATILGIQKIWSTQGLERKKIVVAAFACWVFLFFGVMTNVVLPLWGIFILQLESPAFSLFFIIPAFYAIQKYRFFNFSYASLQVVRWLILFGAFAAITLGMEFVLTSQLEIQLPDLIIKGISILAGLVALKKLEVVFPELLPQDFRAFRNKLQELQSHLYYCKTYAELLKCIEKTFVVDLHFTSVKLFLVREKDSSGGNIPIYVRDQLIDEVYEHPTKVLVKSELASGSLHQQKAAKILQAHEASLCFPLYLENRIIGLFFLGKKEQNDSPQEELEELLHISVAIQMGFINILLQSDLKEENNLMKNMIREKTKNLRQQNEKIKNLLRQQSDFIAVTAHEFRTPLNIALLQLEDTLESYDHSSQVLDDMKVLEGSLDRLKTLTQELFDVQQYDLKKAKLQAKRGDIVPFLQEIETEWKELMAEKSIDFHFQSKVKAPVLIDFDDAKMRQVLHNLLTNAQKFTPVEGEITLQLETTKEEIKISIADTGKGIADEDKKRIFEKFQTTKNTAGMGIGLGLYICKKIVELHAGKIHVEDTPGGGATFIIELPITASRQSLAAKTDENV